MVIMHPDQYLPELVAEKNSLDPSFVHAARLLSEGKSGICFKVGSTLTLKAFALFTATEKKSIDMHCISGKYSVVMRFQHIGS